MAKQEKEAVKQHREAEKTEKAKQAEEERLANDNKRRSREAPGTVPVVGGTTTAASENDDLYREATPAGQTAEAHPTSPTSPNSSKGFKSIFGKLKRRSKHESAGTFNTADMGKEKENEPGFVGGASLRSSTPQPQSQPTSSAAAAVMATTASGDERPHNLGDVEPSTVPHVDELDGNYSDVSSLSSYDEPMVARGRSTERITSNNTGASGDSEFQEAQDHFDEGLAPPPTFTTEADKHKGSPTRDSKFREVGI